MKKFALVGKPVLRSKSPELFSAAYKDYDFEYSLIETTDIKYIESLLKEKILSGINVTAPIKVEALSIADEIDDIAEKIGATNTIVMQSDNKTKAYNTDYLGVMQTFSHFNIDVKNKECLIIGAGGAGFAAAFAMHSLGAKVTIANRTADKATKIAEKINCSTINISQLDESISNKEIIINTLPSNICILDTEKLNDSQIFFDASYQQTSLLQTAQTKGCKCIDGRYWLLYQGIAAYKIFTGIEPNTDAMRKILDI
jgi:Shikimate 5-dehydrogenase